MARFLVVDYYVDEPACFGVPPFISPYVRYTYGALKTADAANEVDFITVDELRLSELKLAESDYEAVFLIAGTTVPGRYLGGKPGSIAEAKRFLDMNPRLKGRAYLGGPIKYAAKILKTELQEAGYLVSSGDIEEIAYAVASRQSVDFSFKEKRKYEHVRQFAIAGAEVLQKHFRHPHHIIELETYRGCTRNVYCSFCTEAFYGRPQFRPLEDILDEVSALYDYGARNFRIGRQADIYTYMAHMKDFKNTFPRPDVSALENLYRGIHHRAPGLEVLHLDNTNPGLIATFPHEAEAITEIIASHNTAMDTAAMGMESADNVVIAKNDLKADAHEVEFAVSMIHKYGSRREGGLPKLSAGLNFIGGLPGETEKTFAYNFEFLQNLLEQGIFLRRINIRQVWTFEKTRLSKLKSKKKKVNRLQARFDYYKQRIRNEIDAKMLAMAFPRGTIIPGVIFEKKIPGGYLGRPLGSYPITCHVWSSDKLMAAPHAGKGVFGPYHKSDVLVVGYKERALYCLALDDDLYNMPLNVWQKVVGRQLAEKIWQDGLAAHLENLPSHLGAVQSLPEKLS